MICNCADEIDLNSFRWSSFIRNLLNLNGNSQSATVRRKKKRKKKKKPPEASVECD